MDQSLGRIARCISLAVIISCAFKMHATAQKMDSSKSNDSLLIDQSGNKYSIKKLLDGNQWMRTNLNLNIPDSYCYDNAEKNCVQFGRLYTWESANRACRLLGDGWRLPSDSEWNQLIIFYGNSAISDSARRQAYKSLLYGGNAGFDAVLGGGRAPDSSYARIDAHGFYWTATETDSQSAWYYNFAKGSKALFQQDGGEKSRAFSVRCMKKATAQK